MNVEPELLVHPKFRKFKRAVGDLASEYLLRLWGHCASNKRGEYWPGATAEYVECVCDWQGDDGQLFLALSTSGFLDILETGVRVHDWEEQNSFTVANWRRNPFGKRGKNPPPQPSDNPRLIHGLPKDKTSDKTMTYPSDTLGEPLRVSELTEGDEQSEGSECDPLTRLPKEEVTAGSEEEQQVGQFAEWPTKEEWMKAAAVQGLPVALAEMEWLNQERKPPVKRWAGVDRTRLQQHASFVLGMARQRGQFGDGQKKSPARPAGSVVDVAAAMAGRVEDVARVTEVGV